MVLCLLRPSVDVARGSVRSVIRYTMTSRSCIDLQLNACDSASMAGDDIDK